MFTSTHAEHEFSYEAGLTGWLDGMISDANNLVTAVCIVAGIIVGIMIIVKNPSVGRAIIGVIVGAFIAALPWIIPAVGELFREDVEASQAPGIVEEGVIAAGEVSYVPQSYAL